jgi:hypothetical protein
MNLIEDKQSLQSFLGGNVNIDLIVTVWSSHRAHPLGNRLSFIYFRQINGEDGIINFNHIDAKKLDKFDISKIIHVNTLVLDNRYLNTIGLDYEWVYFEENGKPFIFSEVVESVYRGYRNDFKELNDCVPLMKWYEVLKTIPNISTRREWDRKYTSAIKTLGRLEGAGVKVVEEKFIDSFNFNPQYIKRSGIVFTQYNPYTTTGRPSNRHLNVNYSALNKSDGSRECFVSRHPHGTLLQFDYESYHIRLIAKMVGYEFPKGISAHQHLANLYGCDYETAKKITFTYLYGGLDDNARGIEFFQKVDEYIKGLYQRFVISGKLTTLLYKREIPFDRIEGANEQKVFNYLLQSLETEINYMKIGEVLEYLEGRMSKMILYTYDAFVIDTHPVERENLLNDIREIMEKGGFPVKCEEGENYNNLVGID